MFAEDHPKGAKVLEVIAGSPAEKSGLKEGDIIVEVNKKKVASKADLQKHVGAAKADQTVKVIVERAGKKKTFDIKSNEEKKVLRKGKLIHPKLTLRPPQFLLGFSPHAPQRLPVSPFFLWPCLCHR